MTGSIAVPLRKAVIAGLVDVLPDHVQTTYAYQHDARDRCQVFTMRSRATTDPAALKSGRNYRNERLSFQIVVHVELPGGSQEDADTECHDLRTTVEEWLADHKSGEALSVAGLNWLRQESWEELGAGNTDTGHLCAIGITVLADARLT